jgi:hypothetical protein
MSDEFNVISLLLFLFTYYCSDMLLSSFMHVIIINGCCCWLYQSIDHRQPQLLPRSLLQCQHQKNRMLPAENEIKVDAVTDIS